MGIRRLTSGAPLLILMMRGGKRFLEGTTGTDKLTRITWISLEGLQLRSATASLLIDGIPEG